MWDIETTFSDRQALAAGVSDSIVDGGGDDLGLGEPVYLQVSLTPGATGALSVTLETSDSAAMTAADDLAVFTVAEATVKKGGTVLSAAVPTGCKRYLRLAYAGASGGKVTAGLVAGAQTSGMR